MKSTQDGFSLIELLTTVAIIAIIAAVGIPAYNGYVQTSREAVLVNNIRSIEIFQEDFRLRTGNYWVGPGNLAAITLAIDWEPEGDEPGTTYAIAAGAAANTYQVTATSPAGTVVCLQLPDGVRC